MRYDTSACDTYPTKDHLILEPTFAYVPNPNRYLDGIPSDSRIAVDPRFLKHSALTPERLQQIRELNDIAIERGQTLAEMSLAWLLHDDAVTSVLAGASKPQQILDNIGALSNTDFSSEELARIDEISKR